MVNAKKKKKRLWLICGLIGMYIFPMIIFSILPFIFGLQSFDEMRIYMYRYINPVSLFISLFLSFPYHFIGFFIGALIGYIIENGLKFPKLKGWQCGAIIGALSGFILPLLIAKSTPGVKAGGLGLFILWVIGVPILVIIGAILGMILSKILKK